MQVLSDKPIKREQYDFTRLYVSEIFLRVSRYL